MATSNPTIAGSDFTLPPAPKRQAIVLLFGNAGEGKTTTGLSHAPGEVAFFDIDGRGLYAAQKAQADGKVIHYTSIPFPSDIAKLGDAVAKTTAQLSWDKFRKNYEIAVRESQKGNIRTIVIDTATELDELVTIMIKGRIDKKNDDYGKSDAIIKAALGQTIKMSREGQANLLMLARAKPIWESNGKFMHRGHDTLKYDADLAGHIRLQQQIGNRKPKFELEVTKAGIDIDQLGQVYKEDDWDELGPFVYMCLMNYPGSKARDWR